MTRKSYMNNLDEYQKAIVTSEDDLLVIAGPGSGKSTTIMHKVNYLKSKNKDEKILLISFTNKSVEDLKKKINSDVFITTFHKLAMDVLEYNNITYTLASPTLLDFIIKEYIFSLNEKDKRKLCHYLHIKNLDDTIYEYTSFCNLIKTFINLFKTNNHDYDTVLNLAQNYPDKYLLTFIFKIYNLYEEEKKAQNIYDFDDLIIKATIILQEKKNYRYFKYIIVDEFQDTSLIRLNLIREIYNLNNAIINVVGDDAQSIFHFSGCDLNIFLNFNKYFPNAKMMHLKNTYRNSKELVRITETFINKNPLQIKKNMQSHIEGNKPVEIKYYKKVRTVLKKTLDKTLLYSTDIMIISRNKKDIYMYLNKDITYDGANVHYKDCTIPFLTIHSSKGLEAEVIIILNNADSIMGLPNKIENHPIIDFLNAQVDKFPYAEERRVFFVGITRCKKKTILLAPKKGYSSFIRELKKIIKARN